MPPTLQALGKALETNSVLTMLILMFNRMGFGADVLRGDARATPRIPSLL